MGAVLLIKKARLFLLFVRKNDKIFKDSNLVFFFVHDK